MTKQEQRKLDERIEESYYRQAQGTQIMILNIQKLFREAREAVQSGADLDASVKAAIEKYDAKKKFA